MPVLFLFFLTYNIGNGYLGFGTLKIMLPESWYGGNALFALGFTDSSFYSADYFPLLPWLFVFIAGTYLGVWAQQGRFPEWAYRSRAPFFQLMGRHSLAIYILHQPVIYGVLAARFTDFLERKTLPVTQNLLLIAVGFGENAAAVFLHIKSHFSCALIARAEVRAKIAV